MQISDRGIPLSVLSVTISELPDCSHTISFWCWTSSRDTVNTNFFKS